MILKNSRNHRNYRLSQLVAFLLLICISTGFVPFNLLHHHHGEDEEICNNANKDIEADPCHISLYHGHQQHACDHGEHFSKKIIECEFCQYYSAYEACAELINESNGYYASFNIVGVPQLLLFYPDYLFRSYFNKGPPVISFFA